MTTTETTFVSSSFSYKLRLDKACESSANEKMSDQIFDFLLKQHTCNLECHLQIVSDINKSRQELFIRYLEQAFS